MSLVRRAFFKKSVISVLVTAAVITLLVFAGPQAQAVEITVTLPASGILGSPVNFTVKIDVENTDLLPIYKVNLLIKYKDNPGLYTRTCVDLPRVATASPKNYPHADGNVSVSAVTAAGWGTDTDNRWGYGYKYPSGPDTQEFGTGYGYGYVDGGHQGATSITYNVTWTTPAGWPAGAYEIEVLVYVDSGGTALTHPETYSFPLSTGGGGGAGGGMPIGVTFFMESRNPEGEFLTDIIAQSWDKQVTLKISKGTIGKNPQGAPLSWVSINPMEDPPPPPEDVTIIGIPYNLGPNLATFDPPARVTFKYNPASFDDDINEEELSLAYYNSVTKEWIVLENITVDTEAHTISGDLSHFTVFAILHIPGAAEPEIPPEPEPTHEPEPEPVPTLPATTEPGPEPETPPVITTEPEPGPEPETVPPIIAPIRIDDSKGINQWVLAGSVFGGAVLIIGLAIYLFWYRKILE